MTDTVTAPGAGALLGFDLVTLPDGTANVYVARQKAGYGADGSYADVQAGKGKGLPTSPQDVAPDVVAATAALDLTSLASALAFSPAGYGTGILYIPAFTGAAILTAEQSQDGNNWFGATLHPAAAVGGTALPKTSTIAASGSGQLFKINFRGVAYFRLVVTTAGTGTMTPQLTATSGHALTGIECTDPTRTIVTAVSGVTAPQLQPPVTASSAYSAGQVIGGLLQFTAQPASGYVAAAEVVLASGSYASTIDIFLFNANPGASTVADHGAFVLAAADMPKLIGVLHLTDLTAAGVVAILQGTNFGQPFALAGVTPGTTGILYAVAVARGPLTLATTADLTATLQVVR